jgi:hypothetical protein
MSEDQPKLGGRVINVECHERIGSIDSDSDGAPPKDAESSAFHARSEAVVAASPRKKEMELEQTARDVGCGDASARVRRRQRKPSIGRMIAQAKKAGATSITTPDGYTMRFRETAPDTNALDNWLARHADKAQRH